MKKFHIFSVAGQLALVTGIVVHRFPSNSFLQFICGLLFGLSFVFNVYTLIAMKNIYSKPQ